MFYENKKFLTFAAFMIIFVIFTYQIVSLGMIFYQNSSAVNNEIQSLANEEGVVIRNDYLTADR